MVYKASAIENFATDEVRNQVMHAHRRILEAIVTQEADVAERRMGLHLAALTAACRAFPTAPLVLDF
jgi:DNA-binding FadR family transcriptional regulator